MDQFFCSYCLSLVFTTSYCSNCSSFAPIASWMLTDAVSAARVSSFSKVARRSGLQHVHVLRSLSRENQIGRSPHTTQSRGLREFS